VSDVNLQAGVFTYTRTDSVALPQSAAEMRFAIRRSDWERLKRSVELCGKEVLPNLAGWYFCFFGIGGSAMVSLYPLASATGVPTWVIPAYGCVTVFATVLGIVLMVIDRRLSHERKGRLDELGIDMNDIEDGFTAMQ
jgi:hypothetical protein